VGFDAQHRQLVIPKNPERRAAFKAGQRAILQSLPGAATWGLVSGVAMVKGGLGVPWAIFMSLTVYAGSAQLARCRSSRPACRSGSSSPPAS
jgi:predicted branched-subunit amino acid permease